ncbi:hypothetical protein GCM10022247_54360 [Allokutzneria multivorans]|uniref:Uncharacterized protein n=1 Tax=Allokutzneria multivorans TaxID=1142134 RepID=A0ABP7T9V2_9PSEU
MASPREVAEAAVAALPVQLLLAAEDAPHEAAKLWLTFTQGSADQAAEDVYALLHAAGQPSSTVH